MAVELTCTCCQKLFEGRPNRLYCSTECRRRAERNLGRRAKMENALEREKAALVSARAGGQGNSERWCEASIARLEAALAKMA